jgi:uncharacterized protein involved in exopolysaccharide biosynthesis
MMLVKYNLDERKNHLREETLNRAMKIKEFIEEQINITIDAPTRDRLYSLLGQEVYREMMARNQDQFGFRFIDSPRVPDLKSSPRKGLISILVSILSFSIWAMIIAFLKKSGSYREVTKPVQCPSRSQAIGRVVSRSCTCLISLS